MKFDLEVVRGPGAHHQADDAMLRLSSASLEEKGECDADVDDGIPIYCIL